MELIIEEVSRGQKLLHRHKLQKSHISLGRSYQNDIIINDPHICPEHVNITFNGEHWLIQDNDSLNGIFLSNSKNSAHQHIVKSGDIITLGKSQIRLIFPDHPVAESIKFSSLEGMVDIARHPLVVLGNIFIFCALTAWVFHLGQMKTVSFTHLLVPTLKVAILFSLWPLAVALISHLTKHDARTLSQLGVGFLFFNLLYFSDFLDRFIAFNFSSSHIFNSAIIIIPLMLTYGLFWLNCHIGFNMSSLRRIIVPACLTLLLFGGSYLIQLSKQPDFSDSPHYNGTLMTPNFNIKSGISVSEFIDDSKSLFQKTAQEAQKKP